MAADYSSAEAAVIAARSSAQAANTANRNTPASVRRQSPRPQRVSQLPWGQQHLGTPLQQRAALSRPPPDEERPEMISTTCKLTCTHSPIVAVTKAAASPNLSHSAAPRGSAAHAARQDVSCP